MGADRPRRSPPVALSALSEVGEALGSCEGVGLQGEEVLLRQQEAGALRGVGGLVQLQRGEGGGVLEASRHGCRRGRVGGRRRRGQSLRALGGGGGRRGDGGGHHAAVLLLLLLGLTSQREPPHGAAAPGRAGAGGGRAGLTRGRPQARGRRGEDHGDGLALAAAQREADGLLGGLLGPQAGAAVDGHQRADHDEGDEDASDHEEGHVDGL